MNPDALRASVVAGLATGPRSFTGLAAVVLATPREARAQPDRFLAHPATKTAVGMLALNEWVLDKLPKTPSRLEILGLITRSVGAGASGAVFARRAQVTEAEQLVAAGYPSADEPSAVEPPPPDWKAIGTCAATSTGVALGVAVIGVALRGCFDRLFGADWPGAALEDASSAGLAAASVYLSTTL